MCVASCVFVGLKCVGYLMYNLVMSSYAKAFYVCMWIVCEATCLVRALSIAYNLVLGVLLATKCLFDDFPRIGHIEI